ncbi:MAG TPA: right-handed parallel beta-helix repeat-containing protein [Candidatus Eisenbergiella merdipullorum]|uniref:Right-handed parallel beta-helix repeat-containing protein n=1 Tax=Candidatus Eisenbergiella merdipullorum TaxID=2838553 RepID=A0A9D2IAI8_9FIRM|nr:right-handed parallel beta-helix repeat-containing protein [Candidatus Eisenbergiella merdipullorum]
MGKVVLKASDFGAVPNTGEDMAPALRLAITKAAQYETKKHDLTVMIQLEAGEYRLAESVDNVMLPFRGCSGIILKGVVDEKGEPCTWLKVRLKLQNDVAASAHIALWETKDIRLENLIFDYTERFSSAGKVVEADPEQDRVVVDVLEGQSHFDGMKCYSANSWNLKTREMNNVDALTIGVNKAVFSHTWRRIPGGDGRRYEIQGMHFARLLQPGDGMSWHFNVVGQPGEMPFVIYAEDSENIQLENIRIYSCIGMTAIFKGNKDITMKNIRVEPEGTSLAVSPRDFAWFVANSGKLLVENAYVKGVRWDPFNIHSGFCKITSVSEDRAQVCAEMKKDYLRFRCKGDKVIFWTKEGPVERRTACIEEKEAELCMTLTEKLPSIIMEGMYLTPGWWNLDEAVFRHTTIEGNCGTGILYQNENLLVEDCIFRNNTYDDIGLGPIDPWEGCFARNIVIRNNVFEGSAWMNKYRVHDGAISIFNGYEPMRDCPYNCDIVIENNVIRDQATGISIRNAEQVRLAGNRMERVKTEVLVGRQEMVRL